MPRCPVTKIRDAVVKPSLMITGRPETVLLNYRVAPSYVVVFTRHFGNKLFELDARRPPQLFACLTGISKQSGHLGWAIVARVYAHNNITGYQCIEPVINRR